MLQSTQVTLTTHTPAQTQCLGACVGQLLQTGLVVRLNGDLGAGKTCFVQGLAKGLQVPADYDITSPTYTLVNEYPGRLPFFHVDLYRLNTFLDMESIGLWDILDRHVAVAVEWADRLPADDWPKESVVVTLRIIDDQTRNITLNGCGRASNNLIGEITAVYHANCPNHL